jgi:hypothetical protein
VNGEIQGPSRTEAIATVGALDIFMN